MDWTSCCLKNNPEGQPRKQRDGIFILKFASNRNFPNYSSRNPLRFKIKVNEMEEEDSNCHKLFLISGNKKEIVCSLQGNVFLSPPRAPA